MKSLPIVLCGLAMMLANSLNAADVSIAQGSHQAFRAVIYDQFGDPLPDQSGYVITWSATGGELLSAAGDLAVYRAGSTPGDFAVRIDASGLSGSATVNIFAAALRSILIGDSENGVWILDSGLGRVTPVAEQWAFDELDTTNDHVLERLPQQID